MSSNEEQERIDLLVTEVQDGNTDAFEELYDYFFPKIYKYIFYKAKEADVDDLVANVFIKAWSKIKTYKKTEHNFSSWLFRIAHNTVIDYYRTHKATVELGEHISEDKDEMNPAHLVNQDFESQRVHRALRHLDEKYQQVIILKFLQDLPNKEISSIMGVQETSVRTLQFRALRQLRALLEDEENTTHRKLEPEENTKKKSGLFSPKRWFAR